jgi:hypothetical protein
MHWVYSPFYGGRYAHNTFISPFMSDDGYKKLLSNKSTSDYEQPLIQIVATCSRLRSKGWNFTFIRIPISKSLLKIENAVCDPKLYKRVIESGGFRFIDYSSADYQTYDGSHLTPEAAELFTHKLYLDMKYPKPEEDRAIGKY